ncbi:hypothetical protein FHX42_001142 [Saccharopolyspora lacisalsi]|uniref:Uncharacterized protein n=1 Tax=Halosaccharopolyspora lacisalsi TaxID=1000566 RepID=A0A839DRW3_9PSEU|nr:hypothetical protein [Halosaccharopolyspora lacisalsi]MBA8823813.1 hypothetical protein [Halosaccharopolyspora lacisalsi]
MTRVHVVGYGYGDGWLETDTQEWIDDRGEYAQELTEDLRDWMAEHDHEWPHDDVLAQWVTDRTGQQPCGLHGDGLMWHHQLCNFADHLLDDFGFVLLSTVEHDDLMVIVSDQCGRMVQPEVYRSTELELETWADYSRATGECARGHRWMTEDTVTLRAEDGRHSQSYRVAERIRVPFDDRDRAYVACPDCGKAVHFETY